MATDSPPVAALPERDHSTETMPAVCAQTGPEGGDQDRRRSALPLVHTPGPPELGTDGYMQAGRPGRKE